LKAIKSVGDLGMAHGSNETKDDNILVFETENIDIKDIANQ